MTSQTATGKYGSTRIVDLSYEQAIERTKAALKEQGFGVLSEIDIQKAMKEKLGIEFPRHLILGACNPNLARQALEVEPSLGLLLPCNVVIRETEGKIEVAVIDAEQMLSFTGNDTLRPIAEQANTRLKNALAAV